LFLSFFGDPFDPSSLEGKLQLSASFRQTTVPPCVTSSVTAPLLPSLRRTLVAPPSSMFRDSLDPYPRITGVLPMKLAGTFPWLPLFFSHNALPFSPFQNPREDYTQTFPPGVPSPHPFFFFLQMASHISPPLLALKPHFPVARGMGMDVLVLLVPRVNAQSVLLFRQYPLSFCETAPPPSSSVEHPVSVSHFLFFILNQRMAQAFYLWLACLNGFPFVHERVKLSSVRTPSYPPLREIFPQPSSLF